MELRATSIVITEVQAMVKTAAPANISICLPDTPVRAADALGFSAIAGGAGSGEVRLLDITGVLVDSSPGLTTVPAIDPVSDGAALFVFITLMLT
jgi:hypothetical protein